MALRFATQEKSNSIWKAAYDGDSVRIAELLKAGADPNDCSRNQDNLIPDECKHLSPIKVAAEYGYISAVRELANHPKCKPDDILAVMRKAIETQNSELKKIFLDAKFVNLQTAAGTTPLCLAALFFDKDYLDELLKLRADPNLGDSPLSIAALYSYQKETQHIANSIIEKLLNAGASPHRFNHGFQMTPLNIVMNNGNIAGFRILMAFMRKEKVEYQTSDGEIIPWYRWYLQKVSQSVSSDLKKAQLLVEYGADINDQIDTNDETFFETYSRKFSEVSSLDEFRKMLADYDLILNLGARLSNNYETTRKNNPLVELLTAHRNVCRHLIGIMSTDVTHPNPDEELIHRLKIAIVVTVRDPHHKAIEQADADLEKRYQEIKKRLETLRAISLTARTLQFTGSPLHRKSQEGEKVDSRSTHNMRQSSYFKFA